ncbi:MAG: phospholipase [Gammaproteobacteria bacterium]|nr:phospholipase [Gammaproteobacteria bacterium]
MRFLLATALLFSSSCFAASHIVQFQSAEHDAAGSEVRVFFSHGDVGHLNPTLHLPNGLPATYGQLVAMGDFYGIADKPIAFGKTALERESRFIDIFNTLATNPNAVPEFPRIISVMQEEETALADGLKKGEKPENIYHQIGDHINREYNGITGGSSTGDFWYLKEGRYLKLSAVDFDHFGQDAMTAYQAGHQVALKAAIAARVSGDPKQLELAYAMNAFACHFLSDLFASGHLRTPRRELSSMVTPSVVGALLVTYMHNEENEYGLRVHDQQNHRWVVYGDDYYFDPQNTENRIRQRSALQASADEIFSAFQTGVIPPDQVTDLIPQPDESVDLGQNDIAPLFYYDKQSNKLMRRSDLTNVYDRHWTSNWWGIWTLIELKKQRGLTSMMNAQLGQSPSVVAEIKSEEENIP